MVARFWGSENSEGARWVAGQSLILSVLVALVLMVLLIPASRFRVPTTYLFAITLGAGLRGVWLATAVDWSMRALIMFFLYMRGGWKTVTV